MSTTQRESRTEEKVKTTSEEQQQGGGGLVASLKGAFGIGGEKGEKSTTSSTTTSAEQEVRTRVDNAAPGTPPPQASKASCHVISLHRCCFNLIFCIHHQLLDLPF